MTSVLLVVLMLLMLIPFSASAETVGYAISGYNCTRQQDYLVIYNRANTYTGTNVYGYEVIVTDGIVTSLGGNNNKVPSNGYVVSGHSEAASWLTANVELGMKVSISGGYVYFTTDPETYKYSIDLARKAALEAKAYAESACLVYDKNADSRFADIESRYNALGSNITEAIHDSIVAEYKVIASLYRERAVSEYRGVWLRPTQKSVSDVETFVRSCYKSGINMISIETMWGCTMICPMPEDSYFEQNPIYNGFDVLGCFVETCHKYGIELHCWMPVFYSADYGSSNYSLSVVAKKPEWALVSDNGSTLYSGEENGLVFINPANPEVQDFLAESYTYLLETYDIDGFQLDYIRYKDRSGGEDFGYDSTSIQLFKQAYPRYSTYNITYNTYASYWNSWVEFRQDQVTKFVERMRNIIDEVAPGVVLSADVGASIDHSTNDLYQKGTEWLENGWLDLIHPMAYGVDYAPYVEPLYDYIDGDDCLVVPGLGIFMDAFDAADMLQQTCEMLDIDCDGVVYFEATAFDSKECGEYLTSNLFTENAIPPALNNANTIVAELERFVERLGIACASGKIDSQTENDLTWIANQAIAEAKNTNANAAAVWTADLINNIKRYVSAGDLRDRLLLDAGNANAAALRDQGVDVYEENEPIVDTIPEDAVGQTQLTIDKINSTHLGEDSMIITDPSELDDNNVKYAYVMLLKPVEGKENVYELVEGRRNTGSAGVFNTEITEGMIVASFHTDGQGSGVARTKLAESIKKGTYLTLWGVDVEACSFTSLSPMLYISSGATDEKPTDPEDPTDPDDPVDPPVVEPEIDCDVNEDGVVDMFDYLIVKAVYFEVSGYTLEEYPRADCNGDGIVDPFDYLLAKTAYFEN